MTLAEREQSWAGRLGAIRDSQARFAWLVDQARHRPLLPDSLRTDAHRVEGCLARLWLVSAFKDGRCWFQCDSDAVSLKAVIGLLCDLYSGQTPSDIVAHEGDVLRDWDLTRHLAENRRRTILRVRDQMVAFARQHLGDQA